MDNQTEKAIPQVSASAQPHVTSNYSHSGRIVNGKAADIASFPYIVGLRVKNVCVCGASVITYWHALTAAHCVYFNQNISEITLYGGSASLSKGGIVFYASKIVIHPLFNVETADYDAAIIQVKNSFQGYKKIARIPLQNAEVPSNTLCCVAGWGYNGQTYPDNLQYAALLAISQRQCSEAWFGLTTPENICAQRGKNGDLCTGDSGGPLVCNGKLTGVTSYGGEGCRSELPSVFTKITAPAIRLFIKTYAGI
uniref:Uncharacterized protein n=1 Tax=Anopheles gambiae TaxID=7165 RepID=A0A1S4H4L9_ANOGA